MEKMKKLNQRGFVLAETLIVTVFLMVIFSMIYTNFFPLIGEYEKREVYDDIDGKYAIFWIKRMIESTSYNIATKSSSIESNGYVRLQCSAMLEADSKTMCKDVVIALQVNGCNIAGDNCDIYISKYQIKNSTDTTKVWFKNVVSADTTVFSDGFKDYMTYLPDYVLHSATGAQYRVFAIFHNTKDSNNYYSYATIEVNG